MAGGQESSAVAADLDPVYEWVDGDGSYLLRLNLPGFKKEDFRVHVDPAGRLNILGHKTADGGAGNVRLHKVFQLPSTSDLDAITGRYDANLLTLTVPKLPSAPAKDVGDKPTDEKSKVIREAERLIEAARARLQLGRHREETAKEPPATKVDDRKQEPKATEKVVKGDDGQDHKEKLEYETATETETQREKKGCWKERAAEEGFKWADTIGKNKEVIAAPAVAAFTLGVFVSHRLFSRN
uniref:Uncharacterized protein n=1 Tax=Aegilops tauschii TaxID=37682 RepID=N1QYT6_AEGTA